METIYRLYALREDMRAPTPSSNSSIDFEGPPEVSQNAVGGTVVSGIVAKTGRLATVYMPAGDRFVILDSGEPVDEKKLEGV